MKKKTMALILAAMCALLSGCVPLAAQLQQFDQPVALTIPSAAPIPPAIGYSASSVTRDVTLYYVSTNQQQLLPYQRTIIVQEGERLLDKVVLALMDAPEASMRATFPAGTQLVSVQHSGHVAIVNLSPEARQVESEQQLLWMRMVLAASLTQLNDIECVQLLIGGRDEGLVSLPSGACVAGEMNLAAAWAQLTAEQTLLSDEEEQSASIERTAILYYPSRDGRYIVPVAQKVLISGKDFITPVMQALAQAPEFDCLRSPLPSDTLLFAMPPEVVATDDGRNMLRLYFDANLMAMLEREELSAWQLCASLTHTLTGFLPKVDGLIVYIGDGQLTRIDRDGSEVFFDGGEMNRDQYADAVGSLATVYLGAADGGLLRFQRAMDQRVMDEKGASLAELFSQPYPWEEGALCVMPDGVSAADVLGVAVGDGCAVVNLSMNFYQCCQGLKQNQERDLIYALVNTLTELEDVHSVRFQLEGETLDALAGNLFLRGPLMCNPGLIRAATEAPGVSPEETSAP